MWMAGIATGCLLVRTHKVRLIKTGLCVISDDLGPSDGLSYYWTWHRARQKLKYQVIFVSSPNMDWCPWIRSIDEPVFLRADGTFGWDDPISWPQFYDADTPHLPCIPVSDPNPHSLVQLFRRGLSRDQVTFTDEWEDSHRVGALSDDMAHELELRVKRFLEETRDFFSSTRKPHFRLRYLLKRFETAITEITKVRDTLPRLRIAFGLPSRYYLEAQGYINYHQEHLESRTKPNVNCNLVGVLAEDERVCGMYHQMGVPVWYVRDCTNVSVVRDKFVKATEPRIYQSRPLWPPDGFRDDGIVRGEPALFQEQTTTGNLSKVVDSWAKLKLEEGFR